MIRYAIAYFAVLVALVFAFGDNGASVATSAPLRAQDLIVNDTAQFGPDAPDPSMKALFSKVDTANTATQVVIRSHDTNHNTPTNNELVSLFISNQTGFDTTTLPGNARGVEVSVECSVDTGGNPCTSTAFQASSDGYAWYSQTGSFRHFGNVDLGPGAVSLGEDVRSFLMPGTVGTATQLFIGWPTSPGAVFSGVNAAVKNSQAGVSVAGYGVALDTTIAPGIRGGFIMSRAAGGISGNTAGLAIAGGTGFPWVLSAANEVNLYNQLGTSIYVGANNVTLTPFLHFSPKDHLVMDASVIVKGANCDGAGTATLVGNDKRFMVTTGAGSTACTVTFANTYTLVPMCTVTAYAGAAITGITPTATNVALAGTAAAGTYVVDCEGQPGST